jgi:hypothetical protein
MERLRKTAKLLCQDSRCPCRDLKEHLPNTSLQRYHYANPFRARMISSYAFGSTSSLLSSPLFGTKSFLTSTKSSIQSLLHSMPLRVFLHQLVKNSLASWAWKVCYRVGKSPLLGPSPLLILPSHSRLIPIITSSCLTLQSNLLLTNSEIYILYSSIIGCACNISCPTHPP